MEMIIIVCLITVIALLLHDKLGKSKSGQMDNVALNKDDKYSKDIIGKPKLVARMRQKNGNLEGMSEQIFPVAIEETQINMESFEQQIRDSVAYVPDFEEEEKELWAEGEFHEDNQLATGVTFEELSLLGTFFRKNISKSPSDNQEVQIMHKLDGTDLLMLLENSIEGAAEKVALLLDKKKSVVDVSNVNNMINSNNENFDIEKFI
jgi:hypothetical protein